MLKKLLLSVAVICAVSTSSLAIESGQPAPNFTVKDVNGKEQSIGEYKGKIIVLEWNNPDCPFVGKHYGSGSMQALQQYAVSKGVVWLTINSGGEGKQGNMTADEAKATVAKVGGHENAYILDPNGKIGHLYGATATPHMFVIDANGNIAYQGAPDDKPGVDPADLKTAQNYVRTAIDDLIANKPIEISQTKAYGCPVKYNQ